MRSLITSDVFAAVRIIRASGMREELKQLIRRALESDSPAESVGIEVFLVIAEAMAEKKSEDAIYEFLAGPFEITPGEVAALPVDKLLEKLTELLKGCNLKSFFKSVSGILGKN